MFELFAERGRAAIDRAREEAAALGHDWLGVEHLLLALLRGEGAAAAALAVLGVERDAVLAEHRGIVPPCTSPSRSLPDPDALIAIGIDLDHVRRRVEASFGAGALEETCAWRRTARFRLTPRSKKVLQLAVEEAAALGHCRVEPEHVLLALTRVQESLGWKLIERRGLSAARVRLAVLDRLRRSA